MIVYPQAQCFQLEELSKVGIASVRMAELVDMTQRTELCEFSERMTLALEPTNTNPEAIDTLNSWLNQDQFPFVPVADQWTMVADLEPNTHYDSELVTGIIGLHQLDPVNQQLLMAHLCHKGGYFHLAHVTPQPWMFSMGNIVSVSWAGWNQCAATSTHVWNGTQHFGSRGFSGSPKEQVSLFHVWSCLEAWKVASKQASQED